MATLLKTPNCACCSCAHANSNVCPQDKASFVHMKERVGRFGRSPHTQTLEGLHLGVGLRPQSQIAHACPTPGELWVIQPPIHPRARPAENGGKFFVLCFQPVTFPCALCAQVTQASARETMATAHSGSARDRHWNSWALGTPRTVQTHSPHSGDRRALPRPGQGLRELDPAEPHQRRPSVFVGCLRFAPQRLLE